MAAQPQQQDASSHGAEAPASPAPAVRPQLVRRPCELQLQSIQAAIGSSSHALHSVPTFVSHTSEPASKRLKAMALSDTAARLQDTAAAPRAAASDSRPHTSPTPAAGAACGALDGLQQADRLGSFTLLSPIASVLASTLATPHCVRLSSILPADLVPEPPSASGAPQHSAHRDQPMAAHDECTQLCAAAQAAAMQMRGDAHGNPSMAALRQWQRTVEAAEQQWGVSHPAVGRAWLELARALQADDKGSDRAKHATKRAFDICNILLKETGADSHAHESAQYLLARFNSKASAAKQTKAAALQGLAAATAGAGAVLPTALATGAAASGASCASIHTQVLPEQLQLPYLPAMHALGQAMQTAQGVQQLYSHARAGSVPAAANPPVAAPPQR